MNNKTEPARGRLAIPRWSKEAIAADLTASLVVFLVAMPLCVGVAVASGVPAELGIITGIVGGLVVGPLSGCPLQVSGPAAGMAVIVGQLVAQHGFETLGLILLIAGGVQLLAGVFRLGQWFRAVSPAVIQGMLAGIGVLGTVTAGIASWLVERVEDLGEQEDLEQGNAPATASDVQALREEVRRLREQLDSRHGSPLDPGPPA